MSLVFPPVKDPELQQIIDIIALAVPDLRGLLFVGSGDPNTVVTASPPALYLNRTAGAATTLYVKESGAATNTGWVGK
jgi:hypothetical protein